MEWSGQGYRQLDVRYSDQAAALLVTLDGVRLAGQSYGQSCCVTERTEVRLQETSSSTALEGSFQENDLNSSQ